MTRPASLAEWLAAARQATHPETGTPAATAHIDQALASMRDTLDELNVNPTNQHHLEGVVAGITILGAVLAGQHPDHLHSISSLTCRLIWCADQLGNT